MEWSSIAVEMDLPELTKTKSSAAEYFMMICGEWEPSGECRAISERHFFLKVCVSDGQLLGPPRSANETTGRPRGQGVAFPSLLSSKECVPNIQVGQHRPPNRWKGSLAGLILWLADDPFTWPQRPFWWPPGSWPIEKEIDQNWSAQMTWINKRESLAFSTLQLSWCFT